MTEVPKSFLQQLEDAAQGIEDPKAAALAKIRLVGKWIAVCPVDFFNELREHNPILPTPAFTLVTRYQDVRDVLRLNHIFSTDLLKEGTLKYIGNTVIELPPSAEYERRKSVLRLAFPMEDVERYARISLEESQKLLSQVKPDTPFDLVDYAKRLPAASLSRYLGFDELPPEKVVQWTHEINDGAIRNLYNDPKISEKATTSSQEIKSRMMNILEKTRDELPQEKSEDELGFFERLFGLHKYREAPKPPTEPSTLQRYLMMQSVDTTYTDDQDIISSLLFMMTSCVDLTSGSITNIVVELMQRPEILKKAVIAAKNDRDEEFAGYVWEALRFRPSLCGFISTCVEDYTLGHGTDYEQVIPKGTLVFICSSGAMHDPRVIDSPEEFITGRPPHLAYTFFEAGLHTCHGKYFSMAHIPLAVKELFKLGVPENVDDFPVIYSYPENSFHIKFNPA